MTKYIQLSEPPKQIRKPRVNQFLPYLNQITQWCQEGKTAIWIHKQLKEHLLQPDEKFKKLKQLSQ